MAAKNESPATRVDDQVIEFKPILKWAGGKRQLLNELQKHYPAKFNRYFEPFLGSAAVYLDLLTRGRLIDVPAFLSDRNRDLIGCYRTIRDDAPRVVSSLRRLQREHRRMGSTFYYLARDERFNRRRIRCGAKYNPNLAALFIYLNRTGFNGLFRVNASGEFNVPVGRYKSPTICNAKALQHFAIAFHRSLVTLRAWTFASALETATSGDFVYLDPPYAPVSESSAFTSYSRQGFTFDDQRRLQQLVIDLAHRGCHVLLSNSTAPEVAELYEQNRAAKEAGLWTRKVAARRAINCHATNRGPVAEFIVTNVNVEVPQSSVL